MASYDSMRALAAAQAKPFGYGCARWVQSCLLTGSCPESTIWWRRDREQIPFRPWHKWVRDVWSCTNQPCILVLLRHRAPYWQKSQIKNLEETWEQHFTMGGARQSIEVAGFSKKQEMYAVWNDMSGKSHGFVTYGNFGKVLVTQILETINELIRTNRAPIWVDRTMSGSTPWGTRGSQPNT